MKRITLTWAAAAAAACFAGALAHPRLAHSADHLDAPATKAEATADINDVYSFMDGTNAILAMTVYPAAPTGAKFSDQTLYTFHTSSMATYGATTSTDFNIICSFDASTTQVASCWAGTGEYVHGDASAAAGIASADGKFKVFAGLRADPFFFNLDGFKRTVGLVEATAPGLGFDDAGCPILDGGTSTVLVNALKSDGDGGLPSPDFFANLNTLAVVVSIDKSLVTTGGPIVSVWGSTNRK